jgi:hypothetical protein
MVVARNVGGVIEYELALSYSIVTAKPHANQVSAVLVLYTIAVGQLQNSRTQLMGVAGSGRTM